MAPGSSFSKVGAGLACAFLSCKGAARLCNSAGTIKDLIEKLMKTVRFLTALFAAAVLVGCTSKQPPTLFEATMAKDVVNKIAAKLPRPIRVLEVKITPDSLLIQVQDPSAPGQVNEYSYTQTSRLGMFRTVFKGPDPVRLSLVNPKLEQNLFDLEEINVAAVPETVRAAVRETALEGGGGVNTIEIKRGFALFPVPRSTEIKWTISVGGSRESAIAYADPLGHITHLDLGGTRRAQTLDLTEGGPLLEQVVEKIRGTFGGQDPVFLSFEVSAQKLDFKARSPRSPREIKAYDCDLNGLHSGDAAMDMIVPGMRQQIYQSEHYEAIPDSQFFSLDEVDWSKLPALKKSALEKMAAPDSLITSIILKRRPSMSSAKPVEWEFKIRNGIAEGFVNCDPKGNILHFQTPTSPNEPINQIEPANCAVVLAAIRDDLGSQYKLRKIEIRKKRVAITVPRPGHPEQTWEYSYNLQRGMEFSNDETIFSHPIADAMMINAEEVEKTSPLIAELEKKTLAELRLSDVEVDWVSFYRQGREYSSKKLLIEISVTNGPAKNGLVIYDTSGRVMRARTW